MCIKSTSTEGFQSSRNNTIVLNRVNVDMIVQIVKVLQKKFIE